MADISISRKNRGKAKTDGSRSGNVAAINSMRAEFMSGDGEPAPRKGFTKIILLVAALLVLGAGGAGAWLFLLQPSEEAVAEVAAAPTDFPKTYIPTDPVFVSYVQQNGRRRQLVVFLTLEVTMHDSNVADVRKALPRLQEAFWRTLNSDALPGASDGAVELTAIKERVHAEADRLLGPHVVHDVLIRNVRQVSG
jgi:flagellar basal body-associated protein FliL